MSGHPREAMQMSSREGRESVFAKLYYLHRPHTPRVLPAGQVHQHPVTQPRAPSLTKPCDLSVVSFPAGDRDLQTPQTSPSSPLSSPRTELFPQPTDQAFVSLVSNYPLESQPAGDSAQLQNDTASYVQRLRFSP